MKRKLNKYDNLIKRVPFKMRFPQIQNETIIIYNGLKTFEKKTFFKDDSSYP